MQYIIANKDKAEKAGLILAGCRQKDGKVIVTEKSLMTMEGASLEEKIASLEGKAYTTVEIKKIIKNDKW